MIHTALGRRIPVELTADPRIEGRVIRLALVSTIALGLVFGLAAATLNASIALLLALVLGWATMPIVLAGSLRAPRLRYLVVVPSALVTLALVGICLGALPVGTAAAAGWLLMTTGVLVGGWLGLWFWFRLLPVPATLDDPLSPGRWALIGVHVALVVGGWTLAASALAG